MTDNGILDLYFARNEQALVQAATKYGGYCCAIAGNLLPTPEDVDECVNDTWLRSWNAIPPARPAKLRLYLGKLCRNLAIDRLRCLSAFKRGSAALLLDELAECLPGGDSLDDAFDAKETGRLISAFLAGCEKQERILFLRRYWYGDSVEKCARFCGIPVGTAKSKLSRTRAKLKAELEKEGVPV